MSLSRQQLATHGWAPSFVCGRLFLGPENFGKDSCSFAAPLSPPALPCLPFSPSFPEQDCGFIQSAFLSQSCREWGDRPPIHTNRKPSEKPDMESPALPRKIGKNPKDASTRPLQPLREEAAGVLNWHLQARSTLRLRYRSDSSRRCTPHTDAAGRDNGVGVDRTGRRARPSRRAGYGVGSDSRYTIRPACHGDSAP